MMNHSPTYLAYFYYYVLRGLLRRQDLQLTDFNFHQERDFILTPAIQHAWQTLFDVKDSQANVPFSYYWIEYEKFFLQAMDRLRCKLQNILHLSHEIFFTRPDMGVAVGEAVQIHLSIDQIQHLDRDRAIIYFVSRIDDQAGNEIVRCIDAIFLKGLTEQDVAVLRAQQSTTVSANTLSAKRKPALHGETMKTAEFYVPPYFGARYGKVSGDRNPVHTRDLAARMFGYPRAFVQGSATVNFLMKLFTLQQHEKLQHFRIQFCKPIFMAQTIKVHFTLEEFELLDEMGKLVAFGTRR